MLKPGLSALALAIALAACRPSAPPGPGDERTRPVYNSETGRLEQIVSDRDGDGTPETRAFMEGARIARIEIDRDGDGRADRWEHYATPVVPDGTPSPSVIERAEESGTDGGTVRREHYAAGRISRVEEDTDGDGRMDKWEYYVAGVLARVELDLDGRGVANHRLLYRGGGVVERVESDADGDGVFAPVKSGSGLSVKP